MIKVLVEMRNGIVVLFSKHYTVDEAKELHRQLGNFLASHAAQQSVQADGVCNCPDDGNLQINSDFVCAVCHKTPRR